MLCCSGGTSGCVLAGRLAEDPDISVLVLEAGADCAQNENVDAPGLWTRNLGSETDWNIVTEPQAGLDGRRMDEARGKVLGGSSGINGTLCIRGTKQDYDDWQMEGWSGEEVWKYMNKVGGFAIDENI